jgi:sec-independent protein translocase protein TatA
MGAFSVWKILIILAIVIVIFGTSRLKSIGGDLGGAIKGFRKAMADDDGKSPTAPGRETRQIAGGKPDAEFAEHADKEAEKHS